VLTSVVHAVHNSAQEQRGAGSRFWCPFAPSISAPGDFPRPPWPVRCGEFLIANQRLEISASPTKQSMGAKSNRERITFLAYDSSCHPSAIEFPSEISNGNSRIIKNSPKCHRNNTYVFSNRNKTAHSSIFAGSRSVTGGLQMRPVSSQEAVRPARKSVRIREEWQSPLKLFAPNQSPAKSS
jgi:hypothetical protein